MGRRAARSQREVYERKFVGQARCPNGKRWTKPSVMIEVMETEAMLKGNVSVKPFLDFVRKTQGQAVGYGKRFGKRGLRFSTQRDSGNVFLEYGWSRLNRDGIAMTEQDLTAALASGAIQEWYRKLCGPNEGKTVKVEMSAECNDIKKLKKRARRKRKAETEEERWKRIGDEHRAQMAEMRAKQAEKAKALRAQIEQANAERALADEFRAMLKG